MSRTVLRQGAQGQEVRDLQDKLRGAGFYVGLDGKFGEKTRDAIIAFQELMGLDEDGVAGRRTWAALDNFSNGPTLTEEIRARLQQSVKQISEAFEQKNYLLSATTCRALYADPDLKGKPLIRATIAYNLAMVLHTLAFIDGTTAEAQQSLLNEATGFLLECLVTPGRNFQRQGASLALLRACRLAEPPESSAKTAQLLFRPEILAA